MFALLALNSQLSTLNGQTVLGKHLWDQFLPGFFNQNTNADTLVDGLNLHGAHRLTNAAVVAVYVPGAGLLFTTNGNGTVALGLTNGVPLAVTNNLGDVQNAAAALSNLNGASITFALGLGANDTNFAKVVGLNGTNYASNLVAGLLATNGNGAALTNLSTSGMPGLVGLIGTMITNDTLASAAVFQVANNFSEVASAATARANLGAAALGGSSGQNFSANTNTALWFAGNAGGLTNATDALALHAAGLLAEFGGSAGLALSNLNGASIPYVLGLGANDTNFARAVGLNGTNYANSLVASSLATNGNGIGLTNLAAAALTGVLPALNAKNLIDLNSPYTFNVVNSGADPTGVTNSRPSIQTAINTAAASNPLPSGDPYYSAYGAAVYLPPGVYLLDGTPLFLPPGINLGGASKDAVALYNTGVTNDTLVGTNAVARKNNFAIHDLAIYQSASFTPTAGYGINLSSGTAQGNFSAPQIERVRLVNLYEGLLLNNCIGDYVTAVEVQNCVSNGVVLGHEDTDLTFSSVYPHDCGGDGFLLGDNTLFPPTQDAFNACPSDSNHGWGWHGISGGFVNGPTGITFNGCDGENDFLGAALMIYPLACTWNNFLCYAQTHTNADGMDLFGPHACVINGLFSECFVTNGGTALKVYSTNGPIDYNCALNGFFTYTAPGTMWAGGNISDTNHILSGTWSNQVTAQRFYGQMISTNPVTYGVGTNYGSEVVLGAVTAAQFNGDVPLLDFVALPVYSYTNPFIPVFAFGTPIVHFPVTSSSTFSSWGEFLGNLTNGFNAVQVPLLPYDSNNVPGRFMVNLRQLPANTNLWTNNPATWPLAWSSGVFSNACIFSNWTTLQVGGIPPLSSNLWLEVISDGYWAGEQLNPFLTNGPPLPSYLTSESLTNTSWVTASVGAPYNFDFFVVLGNVAPTVSSAVPTALWSGYMDTRITNDTLLFATNGQVLGFLASPVLSYAGNPFAVVTNLGITVYTNPIVTSSTFSAWGVFFGAVATPFNAIQIPYYPFDGAALPSHFCINARLMPANTNLWTNNPSSWPLVYTSGSQPLAVAAGYQVWGTNAVVTGTALGAGNYWIEMLMDGRWAGTKVYPAFFNGPPYPSYQTTENLFTTNWVQATSGTDVYSFQMWVSLGDVGGTVTGFTGAAGLTNFVESLALQPTNNLRDVVSAAVARTNLGVLALTNPVAWETTGMQLLFANGSNQFAFNADGSFWVNEATNHVHVWHFDPALNVMAMAGREGNDRIGYNGGTSFLGDATGNDWIAVNTAGISILTLAGGAAGKMLGWNSGGLLSWQSVIASNIVADSAGNLRLNQTNTLPVFLWDNTAHLLSLSTPGGNEQLGLDAFGTYLNSPNGNGVVVAANAGLVLLQTNISAPSQYAYNLASLLTGSNITAGAGIGLSLTGGKLQISATGTATAGGVASLATNLAGLSAANYTNVIYTVGSATNQTFVLSCYPQVTVAGGGSLTTYVNYTDLNGPTQQQVTAALSCTATGNTSGQWYFQASNSTTVAIVYAVSGAMGSGNYFLTLDLERKH